MPQKDRRNQGDIEMKRIFAIVIVSIMMALAGTAAESSRMLSKKELKTLLATARTPDEHNRLAEHYRLKAEKLDAEANDHVEMAKIYRSRGGAAGTKWPASTFTTRHCEDLATDLRKAAGEARELSSKHAEMAKQ
jgi:hypothetical protein